MMSLLLGKYKEIRSLGKGAFGDVVLVEDTKQTRYAVKKISKKLLKSDPCLAEYIKSQKQSMLKLKSQYTVELIEVSEDQQNYYMVLDYCQGGDLLNQQAKKTNKVFKMGEALEVLKAIILGLQFLHGENYLHRDIKPQNILVKVEENNKKSYKLADFGFCKPDENNNGTVLGTPDFMAPEIYLEEDYSYGVDMWAFGVLFYFMLNMQYPFSKKNPYSSLQAQGKKLIEESKDFSYRESVKKSKKKIMENCTSEIEDLFKKIFQQDPNERITFLEIRNHPLFLKYFPFIDEKTSEIYDKSKITKFNSKIYDMMKFQVEHAILKRQFDKIKFLSEAISEMILLEDFIEKYLVDSMRYNVIKYSLILMRHLQKQLEPQKLQKMYVQKLRWQSYCKSKAFKKFVRKLKDQIELAENFIEDLYEDCHKEIKSIKKQNPDFPKKFSKVISEETEFTDFKLSYRRSTAQIYEKLRTYVYEEALAQPYFLALVTILHFFNHIHKASQSTLNKIFASLLEEINHPKVSFSRLANLLREQDLKRKTIEDIINAILQEFVH